MSKNAIKLFLILGSDFSLRGGGGGEGVRKSQKFLTFFGFCICASPLKNVNFNSPTIISITLTISGASAKLTNYWSKKLTPGKNTVAKQGWVVAITTGKVRTLILVRCSRSCWNGWWSVSRKLVVLLLVLIIKYKVVPTIQHMGLEFLLKVYPTSSWPYTKQTCTPLSWRWGPFW